MPGLSMISEQLQRLPAGARKTLYSIISIAGLGLVLCQAMNWKTLGPIDLDQAMAAYAVLSPAAGGVALANVSPSDPGFEDFSQEFYDDFDVSSFNATSPDEAFEG